MSISYLKKNLGISKFAILVPNDAYGLAFQSVSNDDLFGDSFVVQQFFSFSHSLISGSTVCIADGRDV